ncbi:hypothetical protein BRADI_5g09601v3 [Brachypodium distachyon]|uniref:Uncharacterized protein n=1 Tax=Brachypodium distachyon TaxID=15368 RepID=A0A0Q3H331_BRADI|nr:hypothetical protein BRADI_5g09601v3 [Brachypodium distachyon]
MEPLVFSIANSRNKCPCLTSRYKASVLLCYEGKKVTQKLHRDQIGTLKYHGMRNIVRLPICYWLLHSQNDSDWCLALPPIDKMG